jgi:hypothetical protein
MRTRVPQGSDALLVGEPKPDLSARSARGVLVVAEALVEREMVTISDNFLQKLCSYLGTLPIVELGEDRDLSWRDAEQILVHWNTQGWEAPTSDADALDRALLATLKERPGAFPLRPAKYPGRSTLRRLWGNTERVKEGADCSALLTSPPHPGRYCSCNTGKGRSRRGKDREL